VLAVSRAFGGSFFAMAEPHYLIFGVVQTHFEHQIIGHMHNTCRVDMPMLTICSLCIM